jgi:hypothetical protein
VIPENIPNAFLTHAVTILADTNSPLTGPKIVEICSAYAADWNVDIPHATYPFDASSKRQALLENLQAFEPWQQFKIISDLCDHALFFVSRNTKEPRRALKQKLFKDYSHLHKDSDDTNLDVSLVEDAKHLLSGCPKAQKLYQDAKDKYDHGVYQRNVLDDLRLALETLLKHVLGNEKSLENQLPELGKFLKTAGTSKQLTNMLRTLLDYYSSYQNEFVKHNDAVKEDEIEIIFEITSSLMKHLVRLSQP